MVEVDGAAHVSKALPVNAAPPTLAGAGAAGAAASVAAAMALGPAAVIFAGAAAEDVEAAVAATGDATAEARTRSTDELLAPHVASNCTPAVTNCACLSWLTASTLTCAGSVPTRAPWDADGLACWSICPALAGLSQMVSARPTACAGQFDWSPGDRSEEHTSELQ